MSGAKGFTEAELEALSPEERAAIEEYEVDDETGGEDTTEGGEDTTEGAGGDDTTKGGDDTTKGGDDTTAGGQDTPAGGNDSIEGSESVIVDDDDISYVPSMKVSGNIDELKTQLTELNTKKTELADKLKAGDITQEEYMEQSDQLNDSISDKKSDIRREEDAIEFNKNQEANLWQHQQDQFFKTEDGKLIAGNHMLLAAFDSKVRQLAGDDANKDKSGSWFLKVAAVEVKKVMLGAFPAKEPGKGGDDTMKGAGGDGKDKGNGRKPNLKEIPTTLSQLPAAETDDPSKADEFAYLDKLQGSELEDELAKMERSDPAKYDRYLKA
jgi:hypothetical protein